MPYDEVILLSHLRVLNDIVTDRCPSINSKMKRGTLEHTVVHMREKILRVLKAILSFCRAGSEVVEAVDPRRMDMVEEFVKATEI